MLVSAMPLTPARRVEPFTESVIREMTRLALRHGAVNLAQGFPDFPAPEVIKEAACQAIRDDVNQYAVTWGAPPLREAIARKYARHYGVELDPDREITVVCGSTEGMIASLMGVADPGAEIITFEPWYENYGPDAHLAGAARRNVRLEPPDWAFDPDELRRAFNGKTRAIIVNTPHNPTGKVFTREELELIASLCQQWNALCITDEIYEHIIYDGRRHIPMLTIPGMRECTILVNSMSKTYSVTGWRVGWVIAPPALSGAIRKVHDFLTVGAAAPLQHAGVVALGMPDTYYAEIAEHYLKRRDYLLGILHESGLSALTPRGAYYIICQLKNPQFGRDLDFCRYLIEELGVAAVPGSSFYTAGEGGSQMIRFCFCKRYETLKEAGDRLRRLPRG